MLRIRLSYFVIMVVLDASALILIAKAELLDRFLAYVSVPVAIPDEVERNPVAQKKLWMPCLLKEAWMNRG